MCKIIYQLNLVKGQLEKRFSREHTKNPNANVQAHSDVTFWAVGYHLPLPEFLLAFHIYYVKYENTLVCKRISWNLGGMMFKKYFSISYMYNTKSEKVIFLAPKLSDTFMEIGNQMQNPKIETNSEFIYEDVSILSTLIFIKIVGSDTL